MRKYGAESGSTVRAADIDAVTEARFWQFVSINFAPGACWLWTGKEQTGGYGRLKIDRTRKSATRIAYALFNGETPARSLVCHTCDNPQCVRPDHLFIGTSLSNMRDKVKKRRHAHGEMTVTAVLNNKLVQEIRLELAAGISGRSLARQYNVSRTAIRYIKNGSTWAHLIPDGGRVMRTDDEEREAYIGGGPKEEKAEKRKAAKGAVKRTRREPVRPSR